MINIEQLDRKIEELLERYNELYKKEENIKKQLYLLGKIMAYEEILWEIRDGE